MAETLKELYDAKKDDFNNLHQRMDEDKALFELEKYYLKDFEGKILQKVVSTTLNDPATFGHRAIGILSSADPQVVVESDVLNKSQENDVEQFIPALEYEADEMLSKRIKTASFPFFCEQSCIRGWLVGANFIRYDKKKNVIIPDRRPFDSRTVVFDTDLDGLSWVGYKTKNSQRNIKERYKHDISPETSAELLNIYSRTHNEVWIGETKINDKRHKYEWNGEGYVPFVIQPIPSGSSFYDGDAYSHQGESIYEMDRALYPKMNEMASILENLTMAAFFAAMQYESDMGEAAESPEISPYGLGVVVSVEKGGGYRLIPIPDIRNATRLLYSIYENRIQRGSLPNIDYGNLTFPLSAVAISRLTESKDMIFVPRLQGLAMFYQQWDNMAIKQYIQINKDLRLGEDGKRKIFPVKSLKGEYTIKRKYFSMSPEQDIANTAVAQQQMALGMSQDSIFRNTLKLKDPDGEIMKSRAEKAEKLNPVIMLRNLAISLVNQGRYFDAELILQTAEDLLRQRAMGQSILQLPRETDQIQPKNLVPLLEEGGGASRGKTDEEKVEEEINEEERIGRLAETARVGRQTPE